ncbi:MAG: 2-oxoacid:acceptor oxidoreductase subunit alpha [Deltaproteobacteria bacterium]|nr:2-oxoacid:acceptor oxidoreductase subunit alpha [Deltaproteobacteria bacterium]MBI2539583.1 2-oxoacid:acceptor oxidoreductase subunit alpha [Deltaproteobacteria bacterium]MBI2991631.1 2-oxoacid:acceptor oxidoreductase subunit alpha [Deltaproteobacteria bacterium]
MQSDLVLRVAGESGEGVITIGETLCKIAAREGIHIVTFRTFPAEIKGGSCMIQVRLSERRIPYHGEGVDFLICLNQDAVDENLPDLKEHGVLLCEAECDLPEKNPGWTVYKAPFDRIATREIGSRISKNIVVLGALSHLLSLPKETIEKFISEKFARKGKTVLDHNLDALQRGFDFARSHLAKKDSYRLPKGSGRKRLLMTGNEAIAIGATAAGMRYFFGYPITPASEIMEWLAAHLPKMGGMVLQTEDEISAICSVAGASWAGGKSMTSTSGPGLSLMSETIGLLSMAEIPAVIVDSQRGGPSTGMPTKTEQSDLLLALYGSHGDATRVVMAPTSVSDSLRVTALAFAVAEKYQLPVIMLVDQALSARLETVDRETVERLPQGSRSCASPADGAPFVRYQLGASAVSPAALPGTQGGEHMVTGMEHDERGNFACDEETHTAMTVKRFRKLAAIESDPLVAEFCTRLGDENSEIGIVTWGSSAGPVEEALAVAKGMGISAQAIIPRILNPLPHQELKTFFGKVKRVIVPELNFVGQLATLLRSTYRIPTIGLTKVKGVPLDPSEIVEKIVEAESTLNARSTRAYGRAG